MDSMFFRISKSLLFAAVVFAFTSAPAHAQSGAALYKAKCAMCHGVDGKGETSVGKSLKLRDLGSPEVQKQTDAELFAITADGKGKMLGYKGKLTDAQIKDVVAFMRTFKK